MRIELRESITLEGWQHWWVLRANNGQVLATSETYASASNARRAARRIAQRLKLPLTGPTTRT